MVDIRFLLCYVGYGFGVMGVESCREWYEKGMCIEECMCVSNSGKGIG